MGDKLKKEAMQKIKKIILKAILPALIPILIVLMVVIIVLSLFSVFDTVKEKIVELMKKLGSSITGFWRWLTDDYWIDIGQEIDVQEEEKDANRQCNYAKKNKHISRRIYRTTSGFRNFTRIFKNIRRF